MNFNNDCNLKLNKLNNRINKIKKEKDNDEIDNDLCTMNYLLHINNQI